MNNVTAAAACHLCCLAGILIYTLINNVTAAACHVCCLLSALVYSLVENVTSACYHSLLLGILSDYLVDLCWIGRVCIDYLCSCLGYRLVYGVIVARDTRDLYCIVSYRLIHADNVLEVNDLVVLHIDDILDGVLDCVLGGDV